MYSEKHSIGPVDTRGDVFFIFGVGWVTRTTTGSARLVIISLGETNTQESAEALSIISDLAPSLPTIVLSSKYDFRGHAGRDWLRGKRLYPNDHGI